MFCDLFGICIGTGSSNHCIKMPIRCDGCAGLFSQITRVGFVVLCLDCRDEVFGNKCGTMWCYVFKRLPVCSTVRLCMTCVCSVCNTFG
jgi:hypothetical protein